ncbi:MAG: hypothetical protein ACI9DH_001041 [Halioglobus sp.]|jgi:hypothetical protein
MCEYRGDGQVVSLVYDKCDAIEAEKIVNATFMYVQVPAMGSPPYDVDDLFARANALEIMPRIKPAMFHCLASRTSCAWAV